MSYIIFETHDGELFFNKDDAKTYCVGKTYRLGMMGWREKSVKGIPKMGERGQDTGLKDRNGRSVLVGDTIEFDEREWGEPCRFEVKFEGGEIRVPGTLDDARSWWTVVELE